MTKDESPVRPIQTITNEYGSWCNRILCGTPTRGTVRIEWHNAVRGMIIPTNWSMIMQTQPMSTLIPINWQVPDAQNLIIREAIARDFEWLLFLEDDVLPPVDLLVRLNVYMQRADTPVVSGLYYTKSLPAEPLVYRGRGSGPFLDWEYGDEIWADGVPTGCLLIHMGLIKAMWEEAEVYELPGQTTRRIFETPSKAWFDPETGIFQTLAGTSDLNWCTKVMEGDYFAKSGWTKYADKEFPFLVDTNMLCKHITPEGQLFPQIVGVVNDKAEEPEKVT